MIRSMTGFGKSSFEVSGIAFDVELRSVNHRHLDVRVRVPRLFSDHEAALRSAIQDRLARGKVDCTISQAPTAISEQKTMCTWSMTCISRWTEKL